MLAAAGDELQLRVRDRERAAAAPRPAVGSASDQLRATRYFARLFQAKPTIIVRGQREAAVLLALRRGPVYGRELIRRIAKVTGSRMRLSAGTVYPTLRALRAARLVDAWSVVPGRKRGRRSRVYYELTSPGCDGRSPRPAPSSSSRTRAGEPAAPAAADSTRCGRGFCSWMNSATQSSGCASRPSAIGARHELRAPSSRRPGERGRAPGAADRAGRVRAGGRARSRRSRLRARHERSGLHQSAAARAHAQAVAAGRNRHAPRPRRRPDGGFSCVKGEIEGIPFGILPPLVPIVWAGALRIDVAGGTLSVVDLDGLLCLKFRAGGAQDLLDAARLVLLHPDREERARELATAYRALDRFETWLKDPRIRAQAREEAELERRRAVSKPRSKPHGRSGPGVAGDTRRARARKPGRPR